VSDRPADFVPHGDGRWLVRRRFTEGNRGRFRHAGGALHRAGETHVEDLRAGLVPHVSSLKKERIKKQIYKNRELATTAVAAYIDTFYNRTRRHSHLGTP